MLMASRTSFGFTGYGFAGSAIWLAARMSIASSISMLRSANLERRLARSSAARAKKFSSAWARNSARSRFQLSARARSETVELLRPDREASSRSEALEVTNSRLIAPQSAFSAIEILLGD